MIKDMCLAIPGRIIKKDTSTDSLTMAKVEFGGVIKDICIQWVDASPGDYVLAHAGVAITKVDENEALLTLQDFEKIGEYLDNMGKNEI